MKIKRVKGMEFLIDFEYIPDTHVREMIERLMKKGMEVRRICIGLCLVEGNLREIKKVLRDYLGN